MRPKLPKLDSLAKKICTLWFQFFDAFFASKGYPFMNIHHIIMFGPSKHYRTSAYNFSMY